MTASIRYSTRDLCRTLARGEGGAVLVEMAIVLPILAFIIMMIFQVGLFQIERLATARAAENIANVASILPQAPSSGDLAALTDIYREVSRDDKPDDFRVYVKAIAWNEDGTQFMLWSIQDGNLPEPERIVVEFGVANFDSTLTLAPGDAVVVVEIYRKHSAFGSPILLIPEIYYTKFVQKLRYP